VAHSQVDPLPDLEGNEPRSLGDALKFLLLYYYYFEIILIYNKEGMQGKQIVQSLMKLIMDEDGNKYLKHLQEREAYTVTVASQQIGVNLNKLYRITNSLLQMGLLVKCGKLSSRDRGPPVYIYALRDAPPNKIDEAAQLYKDVTRSHVNSLDEYLEDYDLQQVAEDALANHLDNEGRIGTWRLVKLLTNLKRYDEDTLIQVKRIIRGMGYTVVEGA